MNLPDTQQYIQTTLSEADSAGVLIDIHSVVFESAFGRLLLSLEENQLGELESMLANDNEPEEVIKHLLARYPSFQQFVDEAVQELQEKAEALNS